MAGYNLIGNDSGITITFNSTGNQLNVNPRLAPLSDYGGPTKTHALLPGSPAIDSGSNFPSAQDQRGQSVFDFPNIPNVLNASDIGAFERQLNDFAGGSTKFDFDGDGKTDVSIFRPGPNPAQWWLFRSSDGGNNAYSFGLGSDKPVPADFTGDGKTDLAFFRQSSSEWFILRSEDSTFYSFSFGASGDIPTPGDYDGDGTFDPAVYRPTGNQWFLLQSTAGSVQLGFGQSGDVPLANSFVRE